MFAEVLINHSYSRQQERLTYAIGDLKVEPGSGVVVPFRSSKKAGLVIKVRKEQPDFKTKTIEGLLEPNLLLQNWQLELAEWMAQRYFCSHLDVLKLMLPKHIWRVPKKQRKSKEEAKKKPKTKEELTLTTEQKEVVNHFLKNTPKISLLHGVTGAGKTEVYKRLIEDALQKGKQALLLVPEISLTPQFLKYFQSDIPELAVIHSQMSDGKRAKNWKGIHSGEIKLAIGSRSALFSPFKNLGLIIMDEEHEWSYKQDSTPRYHSKKVAEKIAELTGAPLMLGSATPSVESMHEAQSKKIHYYHLPNRIHGTELPAVELIDMRDELRKGNFSPISDKLENAILQTLENKEQIILFLNRRGSASATVCRDCGHALSCKACDAKLTYHASKYKQAALVCHHCGLIERLPERCPSCNGARIRHFGSGTEKIQDELQKRFPTAKIARADRDTMTKRDSFDKLHEDLHNEEIDILIGTQMIGKGFDLPKVSLVGIVLADIGLHLPDFRASERAFQILTQVAGRAGRRKTQGKVLIQTYTPEHPTLQSTQTHDYLKLYEQEISSRNGSNFPPFGEIIKLIIVDKNKITCHEKAQDLATRLKELTTDHEIYCAPALIPRQHHKYHWHLFIQGPSPSQLLKNLDPKLLEGWRVDVDPLNCV